MKRPTYRKASRMKYTRDTHTTSNFNMFDLPAKDFDIPVNRLSEKTKSVLENAFYVVLAFVFVWGMCYLAG